MKLFRVFLTVVLVFLCTISVYGQAKTVNYDLFSMAENNELEVFNREITTFSDGDKKGISFSKNQNDGMAWLNNIEFSDGIIELDIRGKDAFQQSFLGVAFHGIDNETLDAVYFRPFNFQSPEPVRMIHAVQYISHPDYTWAVLREKFNGKYEKAVNPAPGGNDWFHVKIVIMNSLITVNVNGNKEASLSVNKLNNRKTGKIGLWVGNGSDGDFANLQITFEN